jgi:hypothetical protein
VLGELLDSLKLIVEVLRQDAVIDLLYLRWN